MSETETETETETIDRLFLELSQFTKATTAKEISLQTQLTELQKQVETLKDMVSCGYKQFFESQEREKDCENRFTNYVHETESRVKELVDAYLKHKGERDE